MVSTAEKYALEIEIFTLSRGFRAQISHSCVQKRRFQQSACGQSERTDFFNTIGQKQPSTRVKSRQPPQSTRNSHAAIWDSNGEIVCSADAFQEALVAYDIQTGETSIFSVA
jgi:predicted amidohydrolase